MKEMVDEKTKVIEKALEQYDALMTTLDGFPSEKEVKELQDIIKANVGLEKSQLSTRVSPVVKVGEGYVATGMDILGESPEDKQRRDILTKKIDVEEDMNIKEPRSEQEISDLVEPEFKLMNESLLKEIYGIRETRIQLEDILLHLTGTVIEKEGVSSGELLSDAKSNFHKELSHSIVEVSYLNYELRQILNKFKEYI